jgi:HEAT repeat protein
MSRIAVVVLCAVISDAAISENQRQAVQSPPNSPATQLDQALLGILTANRYDLAKRVQVLADLVKAHDILPLMLAKYETTPTKEYGARLLALGIVGELRDERALDLLVKILSTKLPPADEGREDFRTGARAEEEGVHMKAVHAVGYMRSARSRQVLLSIMRDHESYTVRAEAVSTYVWNSENQSAATQELLGVLPESLRPVVTMPIFYRDMNRVAFDKALADWRKQWSREKY